MARPVWRSAGLQCQPTEPPNAKRSKSRAVGVGEAAKITQHATVRSEERLVCHGGGDKVLQQMRKIHEGAGNSATRLSHQCLNNLLLVSLKSSSQGSNP